MSKALTDELSLDDKLIYLNHAAIAPWPRRAVAAVQAFAAGCGSRGSEGYPQWQATEQRLRERLADLIGAASPEDVALAKSTSEALSFVAQGLDWQAGDNIVGKPSPERLLRIGRMDDGGRRVETGVGEVEAVFVEVLRGLENPSAQTRAVMAAVLEGRPLGDASSPALEALVRGLRGA